MAPTVAFAATTMLVCACTFAGVSGSSPDAEPDAGIDAAPAPIDCGDGELDPAESCDDGGKASGDGCDALCQIEPGFECENADCVEVDSLEWVGAPTLTGATLGDSAGGSPFALGCEVGEVAVGFDGISGSNCGGAGGGVGRLELRCASVEFDDAGVVAQLATSLVGDAGVCSPAGAVTAGQIDCPAGSVVVGIRGNPTQYVTRLEGVCQPLSHLGGDLVLGDDVLASGSIGPIPGTTVALNCPPNHIVAGVSGRSGQVIDRLDILCVALDVAP